MLTCLPHAVTCMCMLHVRSRPGACRSRYLVITPTGVERPREPLDHARYNIRLQPLLYTVAASIAYGCRRGAASRASRSRTSRPARRASSRRPSSCSVCHRGLEPRTSRPQAEPRTSRQGPRHCRSATHTCEPCLGQCSPYSSCASYGPSGAPTYNYYSK